ncbi:MAG: Sulfopyruvate decarboxylase, TPP-binding subunit (coenzyme M biosynthesis) [Chloroflexi bacterium]|jgi:sulfopyruvate decarboxylase subunit alpha|nr:MAG: Sulfopyruvate decarboxylase, TPP-binding subunit (coenzyme M biosynthesis) [Chloroflexota bacterium]
MTWAEDMVGCLKESDVSLIAFVPDISIAQVTQLLQEDPYFHVVSATREEEAIGIAAGAYAVGRNAAVFMQSSGFGNSINAINSLCIPCRIPIPLFINLRGELNEFNIAQVPMGRSTRPILDVLGITNYTLDDPRKMPALVSGALKLCYASREPLALCMTPLLHEGKLA